MFLYFDLGNVLAFFDRERSVRQMAAVAGVSPDQVRALVHDGPMGLRYERGELSSREFHAEFCRELDAQADFDALMFAAGDIFQINRSLIPVVAQLEVAGHRLGILSNTCECHWQHIVRSNYCTVPRSFQVLALSYQIGALKPEPKIYEAAAKLAGVAPSEIFFCDDIAGHVAGARAAGFDAVQYTDTPTLVADLHRRGVRFNY